MRGRTTVQKENKENDGLSSQVHTPRRDAHVPNRLPRATALSPKTSVRERDIASLPLVANLSGATTVAKGSVRDRMMDWERERERLREMVMLTDTSADGHVDHASTILTRTSAGSDSSDGDDSRVEAEVVAEVASAQAGCKIPIGDEIKKEASGNVEDRRLPTMQSVTTISSSLSNLERSRIEVAKVGVRTSAQILSSCNGSITALGLGQSTRKRPSEESRVKNDTVADIGLPVENRNGESGFNSLKHSVKASIGEHLYSYLPLPDRSPCF